MLAVIALWFVALVFWNLGAVRSRFSVSPLGCLRFTAGTVFVLSALVLLYESFPYLTQQEFSYFAIGTFIAALIADFLVGDDIRRRLGV